MSSKQSSPQARYDQALTHFKRGQYAQARKVLIELHRAYPRETNILRVLGASCGELGRLAEATGYLARVVALEPSPGDYFNLGKALQLAGHYQSALTAFGDGLARAPADGRLTQAVGSVLIQLRRYDEAIAMLEGVLAASPDFLEALVNLGNVLLLVERTSEAIGYLERALVVAPDHADTLCALALAKRSICDWSGAERAERVRAIVKAGKRVDTFALLVLFDDPELHRMAAATQPKGKAGLVLGSGFKTAHARRDRIKVAYLSADFRAHPTSYLIAGLLEAHDRAAFEVVAIATGGDDGSEVRQRIERGVDTFVDGAELSPGDLIEKVRSLEADIVVDLMGHTRDDSAAAFAARLAPVQVNFLGYPGTTAIEAMDYIIVDREIASARVRQNLTEKLVVMPHCYQINDPQRPCPPRGLARAAYGLPEAGFVFCCFNAPRKISPVLFASWMAILAQVQGSVLWLYSPDVVAQGNLQKAAHAAGIAPERLVFATYAAQEAHLARYRAADLMLDTLPYGAHTTASDALWMGCPVLTLRGESFAARVGASLLTTIGLPSLITDSLKAYQALAVLLASQPDEMAKYRAHLEGVRATTPLFDAGLFTRDLERAYGFMTDRSRSGKAPKAIDLS